MALVVDAEFTAALGLLYESQKDVEKPKLHDVEARRARYAAFGGRAPKIPESVVLKIITIPHGKGLDLRTYHFDRRDRDRTQLTAAAIHFHGGGLISCSPEIATERLALMTQATAVQIFSVEYRLAPEHRYPAALDDGWDTLLWIIDHAHELGIDMARIAVMGDSAGGGLAAAMTIRAREMGLSPPLARQILCSPMLDDRTLDEVPGNFNLWNAEDNLTAWTAYLGKPPGGEDVPPTAAPARVKDVTNLPPLYLDTSQLDLFVKENLDYVRRFIAENIEVEFHVSPGLPHGFDGLLPSHRVTMQYEEHRRRILSML